MLGNFFKYIFLSKDAKKHCFLPNILLIYNLNVKQFRSQMKPHMLWGFIWIQIVCIGHQRSSKFTASGLRVKVNGHQEEITQATGRGFLIKTCTLSVFVDIQLTNLSAYRASWPSGLVLWTSRPWVTSLNPTVYTFKKNIFLSLIIKVFFIKPVGNFCYSFLHCWSIYHTFE